MYLGRKIRNIQTNSKKINVASRLLLFCTLLFAISGLYTVDAREYFIEQYSSRETRLRLLELLVKGDLDKDGKEYLITQTSNEREFRIQVRENDSLKEITLTPKRDDAFEFPTKGAWKYELNVSTGKLEKVRYYYQSEDGYEIIISPYLSSIEISLLTDGMYVYRDIQIPMNMNRFLTMPFLEFVYETNQLLYWSWLFPEKKFMNIHERSRNLSRYLAANMEEGRTLRLDNLYEDKSTSDSFEKSEGLAGRRDDETYYIEQYVDKIMKYIGTDLVTPELFDPYDVRNSDIEDYNEKYVDEYILNVKEFLKKFPDFYTSVNEIQTPFQQENFNRLDLLYMNLYFMTVKHPGLWYIVPIQRVIQDGENTTYDTIAMEVLIPFFRADGTFEVYGSEYLEQYLAHEKIRDATKSEQYFYKDVGVLRVPQKRARTFVGGQSKN